MSCLVFDFWLWAERISFLASILLGIAAFVLAWFVSLQDTRIRDFNKLLEKNTAIVELLSRQNEETLRIKKLERTGNINRVIGSWLQIQAGMWDGALRDAEPTEQVAEIKKVIGIYYQETLNQAVLEDSLLLNSWQSTYWHGLLVDQEYNKAISNPNIINELIDDEIKADIKPFLDIYWQHYDSIHEQYKRWIKNVENI